MNAVKAALADICITCALLAAVVLAWHERRGKFNVLEGVEL